MYLRTAALVSLLLAPWVVLSGPVSQQEGENGKSNKASTRAYVRSLPAPPAAPPSAPLKQVHQAVSYTYGHQHGSPIRNSIRNKIKHSKPIAHHSRHPARPIRKMLRSVRVRRSMSDGAHVELTAPPPCQPMSPPPDEAETKARFDKFANAFLVTKNITEAFTYISEGYINHNPAARNGAASAWGILSPIWGSQSITVLRTTFKGNQGWLNYRAGGLGQIVDRYRWEDGCIVEHWDQGEKYPST